MRGIYETLYRGRTRSRRFPTRPASWFVNRGGKNQMKRIIYWLIDGVGSIRGDTDGEPIDKGIRTSPVVSREGNIVTTASGSKYELIEPPHPYMTDPEMLRTNWRGATSPLDAVDKFMQKRD